MLTASHMPRMANLVKLHCSIETTGERQEWAVSRSSVMTIDIANVRSMSLRAGQKGRDRTSSCQD